MHFLSLERLFFVYCLALLSFGVRAQDDSLSTSVLQSVDKGISDSYHFPGDVTVTLANGTTSKISELQPGDSIQCFIDNTVSITRVRQVNCNTTSDASLTALYLRPIDEVTASRKTWPLVPALLLETASTLKVITSDGPKMIGELKKGDVLYRYEAASQKITTWKVGIMHQAARRVSTLYSLVTDRGSYLLDNMIALD